MLIDCGPFLAFHLALAGWVRWSDELRSPQKPSLRGPLAAQLFLRGGAGFSLTEQGTQKRLSIYLVRNPEDVAPIARLGPDVLGEEFTLEVLTKVLNTATPIKSALSDQRRRVSGIGNAYSDEILHVAKLSPYARSNSLNTEQIAELYTHIREVLEVTHWTVLPSFELTRTQGRPNAPICVSTVAKEKPARYVATPFRSVHYSARSFQYCPTCQTGGKVLADRRLSKLLR